MKNKFTPKEEETEQEGSFNFALMLVAVIGIAMVALVAKMVGLL